MISIEFDAYYGDDVSDLVGQAALFSIVSFNRGTIIRYDLRGPGGGNPRYIVSFPSREFAEYFWAAFTVGEEDNDLDDHVIKEYPR